MKSKSKDRELEEAEANKISDAINQVQTLTISNSKNEFFRAKMLKEEEERRQEQDQKKTRQISPKGKGERKMHPNILGKRGFPHGQKTPTGRGC